MPKSISATLSLTLALFIAFAAPTNSTVHATSTTITVTDDNGTVITLPSTPHRLISLAPNVTEIFYALGLGKEVVGDSSYSDYPAAAKKLPVVINYTTLAQEKLLSLKPDLIVAADIVPQTTIDKLRSLHLTVLMTNPHDIGGILRDLTLVGAATGAAKQAATLVASLQTRINRVKGIVAKAKGRPTVFYELDPTLYTVGPGSFVDSLITLAGGKNIVAGANPYPQLSKEKLFAANPQDYVLGDATNGAVTPAAVAARPGFSVLQAVTAHHVYSFDDNLASRPGPRIVDGLEKLAVLIHPALFR